MKDILKWLVVWYLVKRHGHVGAIKPPLGYSRYVPRPLWYRLRYDLFLYPLWRVENGLFRKFQTEIDMTKTISPLREVSRLLQKRFKVGTVRRFLFGHRQQYTSCAHSTGCSNRPEYGAPGLPARVCAQHYRTWNVEYGPTGRKYVRPFTLPRLIEDLKLKLARTPPVPADAIHLRMDNPYGYTGAQSNLCRATSNEYMRASTYVDSEARGQLKSEAFQKQLCRDCVAVISEVRKRAINDCNKVKQGMTVVTSAILDTTVGMLIADKNLSKRRPDARGVVLNWVPGHGGDVWWVEHPNGDVAAYCFTELETPKPSMLELMFSYLLELPRDIAKVARTARAGIKVKLMNTPGRFLSNTGDPKSPFARMRMCYTHEAMRSPEGMQDEWRSHLQWLNENLVRPPKATPYYTTEELAKMEMIGLYQPLYVTLTDKRQFWFWIRFSAAGKLISEQRKRFRAWSKRIVEYSSHAAEKVRFA